MGYIKSLCGIVAVWIALCSGVSAEESKFVVNMDKDGVQRVEVIGGSYYFKPDHLVVKIDFPVELKVSKEEGITPHDIVAEFPEAGIAFQQDLGSTPKIIKFTPAKLGTYPFYCAKDVPFFKSHREKGMEGVIEVVP